MLFGYSYIIPHIFKNVYCYYILFMIIMPIINIYEEFKERIYVIFF